LLPVNVNADDETAVAAPAPTAALPSRLGLAAQRMLLASEEPSFGALKAADLPVGAPLTVGSNNWVIAPARSASGAAVVVNDPHLDARMLPGIWHPIGLHAPGIDAVGAALPAVPGIVLGRNARVAFGVTNAYGDSQDLYVEQGIPGKPGFYRDGDTLRPFGVVVENIRVKDRHAKGGFRVEQFRVLTTVRGPVVSEGPAFAVGGDKFLTLRMASAELPSGGIGFDRLLVARNADEVDAAVQQMGFVYFNYVFADREGAIGHRATGRVPIRRGAPGSYPRVASGEDDWIGYIPPDRMPGSRSPSRGWLATANHDTRPAGYQYEYSSYFAPSYRYRRIGEVLSAAKRMTTADHARLMMDPANVQSRRWLPTLVRVLSAMPEQQDLHDLLAGWNGQDTADQAAPLIYHRLYEEVAIQTYADEMGAELAKKYLGQWYLWQERFDLLAASPNSHWFDDLATPARERLDDIVRRAVPVVRADLQRQQGDKPRQWRWGTAHRVRFYSPLRKTGMGSDWLGRAPAPMDGSTDTVMRAMTVFGEGFDVGFFASARLVADLADNDKVRAVVAGGVIDRQFHRHQQDQLGPWSEGKLLDWWLAPTQVEAHAVTRQTLVPTSPAVPSP
jgi:penicillin G amidase